MKAFIAPIYFQTNSISSEKLTGGLLLSSAKKTWLAFSKSKVAIADKLAGDDMKKSLEHTLDMFKNKIAQSNQQAKKGSQQSFEFNKSFTDDYLQYLHKYSKGIIQFAKPKPIALEATDKEFAKLFELYVGEALDEKSNKPTHSSFFSQLKTKLQVQGLSKKADIEYVLKPGIIKGILKPAQITLITKNGSIEAVQAIDFSNAAKTIVEHIYEFEVVAKHLKSFESDKALEEGKYKIVVNKPQSGTDQEKLFNDFYDSAKDTFDIIEPEDMNQVVQEILDSPHMKFSEFIGAA